MHPQNVPQGLTRSQNCAILWTDRVGLGIDTKEIEAMKKDWLRSLLFGLSLALLLLPALAYAQGEVLYGCNGGEGGNPSNLYTIDPTTGAATLVGPMGMEACSGLASAANGALYAVGHDPDNPNDWFSLFVVNPATGTATPIGESHHSFGGDNSSRIADLSFRSDGRLFGYLESDDGLGYLNKATGAVTELGPTGVGCCGNGIAFSAGGVLFHSNEDALHTLNQTTGNATWVADHVWPEFTTRECPAMADKGDPRINALDFSSDGVLYGSLNCGKGGSGPNYLVTVNTANGVITEAGASVDGLDGIVFGPLPAEEFVPEPGTVLLLGSGLAGLAGYATLRWRARE
jgi:hypothetical protein